MRRDPNLDLLRAAAILLVIAFHTTYACPAAGDRARQIADIGAFGVDLFFVLSGWLISGLWWREEREHGDVRPLRFLGRRWLRTVPPYYVAMVLAWLAVYIARRTPFDWGYLIFLENYYKSLPFFGASWSLCVEEQFYLVLPWMLLAMFRWRSLNFILPIALIIVPPILRWHQWQIHHELIFGYMLTATHLHCEGLTLGVVASAIAFYRPAKWRAIKRYASWLAIPAMLTYFSMALWSIQMQYIVGYTALAFIWVILIAALESRPAILWSDSRLIYAIAISSYSLYLVHGLVLHVIELLTQSRHISSSVLIVLMCLVGYTIGAAAFYFCIERSAIQLRDRFLGRRTGKAAIAIEGGVV